MRLLESLKPEDRNRFFLRIIVEAFDYIAKVRDAGEETFEIIRQTARKVFRNRKRRRQTNEKNTYS